MSLTLSLFVVFAFVIVAYTLVFAGLIYAHGRPVDLSKMLDSIPRTRTVLLCILYPAIIGWALVHGLCAFVYQGAKHGYQHLRAIVTITHKQWIRGIKASTALHDPTARAILRQARKAGFGDSR